MTASSVVLFRDGRASLWLTDATYFDDGSIHSGFVENGGWNFLVRDGEVLAKDGRHVVTRNPLPEYTLIPAPRGRGYNEVMAKAQLIYDKQ